MASRLLGLILTQCLTSITKGHRVFSSSDSQSSIQPAASAPTLPQRLLEMQVLRPYSRPAKSETLWMGPNRVFEQHLRIILMHGLCFSDKSNFAPQRTFRNVWRYFWLSQLEGEEDVLLASSSVPCNVQESPQPFPPKIICKQMSNRV